MNGCRSRCTESQRHKTRSVFTVTISSNENDLREAARKTSKHAQNQETAAKVPMITLALSEEVQVRFDAVYLDASAATMLFTREEGYKNLQKFMQNPDESPTVFMTAFCVTETLTRNKNKVAQRQQENKEKSGREATLTGCIFF